ncbi:putative Tigger transposable element-derived protein 1-like 262, partial [Homarus americanus]
VNRDILSLAREAGFDKLESEDIEDVLASHTEEFTNEDLQQLTEHSPVEDNYDEEEPQRTLTSKRLAEVFNLFQQAMQILIDDDPNRE